jgi:hypothetical protein
MVWNSRYTLALLAVIIALLVIIIALYLDPIKTSADDLLAQEYTIQQQYLSPINHSMTEALNITRAIYQDLANYFGDVMATLNSIYYYQRINATNIISTINRNSTRIIKAIVNTNTTIVNSLYNVQNNIENNLTSEINTVGSAIYNAVINVSNYVADNNTEIINSLNTIQSEATMYYQLYGAPYTTIQQSYTLFQFSNLTLVASLLINLSIPLGGNVTILCYAVPGTQISAPIYSTSATSPETITIRITNYPCWEIVIQAPGSTLNWYSGVILYQG